MSKQREVRLAIRELTERPEYKHLSYGDILNIVYYSQFGFVHKVMSDGDKENPKSYKSILIRYLGSFIAHPKRVDLYIERYKKNKYEKKYL